MRRAFLPSLLLLLSAACQPPDEIQIQEDGGVPPGVGPTCLPDCPGARSYDAQAYNLRARFDWDARQLLASEDITLALRGDAAGVVELDAQVKIARVRGRDQDLPFAVDDQKGTLRVDLTPLRPGRDAITFTVEYQAPLSSSLMASSGRDQDPVQSRVFFTDSEPDRGKAWLVANHHPADRALWSVELTVATDEDVVANGRRAADQMIQGGRLVRYQMDAPLPTYLMAFAGGQLVHEDRGGGRVPLALWHRRGLLVDADQHLRVVADAMATFERLLGPYPFERYAVVLLPGMGGGMENATITFNGETSGQGAVSVGLNGHELGHQWFGDYVTMRDYDDVWIKEGMATLLAEEADRARREQGPSARLFGSDFFYSSSDAIRDRALAPRSKYTSGPYGRAAALLTQMRALAGDERFFATLRQILAAHALDSIDSETFIRSFDKVLDAAVLSQILALIDKKGTPRIDIKATQEPGATLLELTLGDPTALLIAPLSATVVDAAGAATTVTLPAGAAQQLRVPDGGYVALDEGDVHALDSFNIPQQRYYDAPAPRFLPTADAARRAWGARSASHQERALSDRGIDDGTAAEFVDLYDQIKLLFARRDALIQGCRQVAQDPVAWSAALTPLLRQPPLLSFQTGFGRCGPMLTTAVLGMEFADLSRAVKAEQAARLQYLMGFDYGPAESFSGLAALVRKGPSQQLQELALSRLGLQAIQSGYPEVPLDQRDAWRALFREALQGAATGTRLFLAWRGVTGLADAEALPAAGQKLQRVALSARQQRQLVCDAYKISQTSGNGAAFTAFQQAAQPWTQLSTDAQAVLMTPSKCPTS